MNLKKEQLIEKPYEKLEIYGAEALSSEELMAIILSTGTKEFTSLEVSRILLNKFNTIGSFRFLQEVSLDELRKIRGIGRVKSIKLKAIGEIAKRFNKPFSLEKLKIRSSRDIINIVEDMKFEKKEILKLIILNTKNNILKIKTISTGNVNSVLVDPKQIFLEIIKMEAPKMILVHNHPSGDATPSKQDIQMNEKVKECAKLFKIELLDHIIIGDGNYISIEARR